MSPSEPFFCPESLTKQQFPTVIQQIGKTNERRFIQSQVQTLHGAPAHPNIGTAQEPHNSVKQNISKVLAQSGSDALGDLGADHGQFKRYYGG